MAEAREDYENLAAEGYAAGTFLVPVSPQFVKRVGEDWSKESVRIKFVRTGEGRAEIHVRGLTPTELRMEADRVEAKFPYLYGEVPTDG